MPVIIPALGRWRQEDHQFETSLGHIMKKKKKRRMSHGQFHGA
jgi:hypothetical protein